MLNISVVENSIDENIEPTLKVAVVPVKTGTYKKLVKDSLF
jgi:hypothetical protein